MQWYHYTSIAAALICFVACSIHFIRLIRLGNPRDFAQAAGNTSSAIAYSMIKAMSPTKKETAYLHLPTYAAGIIFHIGTFAALAIFVLSFFLIAPVDWMMYVFAGFFAASGLSGILILIKRFINATLRHLSNPDDYISNLIVSIFHLITAICILGLLPEMYYYLLAALLFLYLPIGKLKHTVYFFAARYHLGYFYGYRGVWPPKKV